MADGVNEDELKALIADLGFELKGNTIDTYYL